MFVPILVTVIAALGTSAPEASFTSPVIVAVSCCAYVAIGQVHNNMKKMKLMQRDNGLNISFLLWGSWASNTQPYTTGKLSGRKTKWSTLGKLNRLPTW
jgi:hypothetical protein